MTEHDQNAETLPSARAVATTPASGTPMSPTASEIQQLIAFFEREAKALGNDPGAAFLFHEIGLLWEEMLKSPRNAAVSFQNAYRIAPKYLPNLDAARRLFAEVGNWQMVAQLLDAEIAAVHSDAERVALLHEKAVVLDERLGRTDECLAVLEQCRAQAPRDVAILAYLEGLYASRGDLTNLEPVLVQIADAVDDPALKAFYWTAAAQLCDASLGRTEEAAQLYRKAFDLRREDGALLAAVKRAAEREGKHDELLSALAAEAQAAGPGAAPVYYRISRVCERIGRPDQALEALLAGRRVAPQDPLILEELARAYESSGRWEELADILRARVATIRDSNELAAVNLRLGELFEDKLKREDDAIAFYRAVLAASSTHASAISALGKIYFRRQDWAGVLAMHQAEIAATDDPKQRVGQIYKAAELLETRLGRDEEAIARHNEALALQPGYLPSQKALARIYERCGRYSELIAMYEQDLARTTDRDQIVAVLSRVANVYEERLKDLPRAVDALKRVLEVAPDHLPTLRNLARICERAGLWEELIRAHETETGLAGDSKQVISLFHRIAEIWDEELKDEAHAVDAYQKVLALQPAYLPALKALGRLYARAGRWTDLIEMYRQEAEITPSPDAAAGLLFKVGELYETRLSDVDRAVSTYQEVLTLAPSHFPALRALSRIYRAQKSWESLVEVLRAEAAARLDPAERAHTLFQVAALWEDELGRADMAIESYQDVLKLVPAHLPALSALERLHAAQGNWPGLVELYERELQVADAPEPKIAAYAKLARLYLDRLGDPGRAAKCFEAVLALQPASLPALKGLEAIRGGDRAGRAEIRARLAQATTDARAAAAWHLSGALDRERAGSREVPLAELKRAADLTPADPRATRTLERALSRVGDFESLATILERRLGNSTSPDVRTALQMRLAEIYEWQLRRLDKAAEAYRAVLEKEPAFLPALSGACRVASASGQHAEVYRLLMAEAQACHDPKAPMELWLQAGEVARLKMNDPAAARAAYQAALAKDPLEPRASALLEELLASGGGAADLVALHLKRAQTRAANGDAAGAAEEYVAAARICAEPLRDPGEALAAVDHALSFVPSHPGALLIKGELAVAASRFAEAAECWSRRLEQGGDPRETAPLHHRLGVLYQDRLGDAGRATAHLTTTLAQEPRNADALERMGNLHLASRNWGGASDAFRRLLELETDPTRRVAHLLVLGRVSEEGFGDLSAASGHLRQAIDLAPGDAGVLDQLARIYERQNNLGELATILEQQSTAAASAGDKARASTLRLRLAEIFARESDQTRALQSLRFAVDLQPDSIAARTALAEALSQDTGAPMAAIEEHRNLLKLDPCRVASYHVLSRLFTATKQADRALCTGHVLSFLRSIDEAEAATFAEAKGRAPAKAVGRLSNEEMDLVLQHPAARQPLSDVMRIVGDQLDKLYEPGLAALGVGKADRLKPDHPVFRQLKEVCTIFGVEKFEAYLGKRGAQIMFENTEPLSIVYGPDLVRRYNSREQLFLFARAAYQVRNKMALPLKLDRQQLADLLGNAIRVVAPTFDRLGRPDPELARRIRKTISGKAIRQLEQLVPEIEVAKSFDVSTWILASTRSADRAGLLLAGDLGGALQLLFRDDPSVAGVKFESAEQLMAHLRKRKDMLDLVLFVLSDDHFRLRTRLELALPNG